MSDLGRQSIGDKVSAAVKPDSEKSTPEHVKDTIVGKADDAAGKATRDEDKTLLQKASDAVFGESK